MGQPKTKKTTNETTLPGYLDKAYKGVVKAGANVAKKPLKQYTGPRTAGFTPDQEAGFGMIRNAQGAALPYINAASSMYTQAGQLPWQRTMGSTVDAAGVNAAAGPAGTLDWGSLPTDTNDWARINAASGAVMPGVDQYDAATMAQYMDPYMQQMIDPIMQRMQQEDSKQINNLKGSGIAMGLSPALGDRMGLAASDLAGQQALSRNQTLGQLMSQGFQNAQTQLGQQQQLQLQGGTQDQARLLDAARLVQSGQADDAARALQSLTTQGTFNQQDQARLMEAQQLLQQGRQEDANRILQSLSTQQQGALGAAQGMANLGTQAQDSIYQGIDYLMNAGQMQQQLGQTQLDQAYNDWAERNNYPKSQVDWLANLIYGSPGAAAQTQTTTEPGPSILSQLLGAGTTALGLGRTFGSASGGRVVHRDLGGAIYGEDPTYTPPTYAAPQIDVGMFRMPAGSGTPISTPTSAGLTLGGSTYINALAPLTEADLGAEKDLRTKLPKNIRKPIRAVSRGVGNLGGGGGGGKDSTKDGKKIIRRDQWGNVISVGGKPVKRALGGLIPETDDPVPGTPEYDAALAAALAEPTAAPALTGGPPPPPAPVTDLGGAPPEGGRRSRMGDFFSKVDPLVYAGLGIMGGESPFPLTNVGQGGAAGLKLAQDLYATELDDKPMVDDSGPTIRYWTAGEGWTDSGIPSYKWAAATTNKATGTEKERFMEGKYGPKWRTNPEAIGEFEELLKTPDTMIDMKGQGAFATKNAEKLSEKMFEVIDGAAKAQSLTSTYGQIATLLNDPSVYTGTGGETVNALKKMASTLFGLDVEGVAAGEVAKQTQQAAIGQMREEVLGPGVMSNSDRQILEGIFPGLSTSAEGIQLAYEIQKLNTQAAAAKARKLQEIISATDGELTPQGWFQFQNWVETNPFFTPEIIRDAQARAKANAIQRAPTAGADSALEDVKKKWGLE